MLCNATLIQSRQTSLKYFRTGPYRTVKLIFNSVVPHRTAWIIFYLCLHLAGICELNFCSRIPYNPGLNRNFIWSPPTRNNIIKWLWRYLSQSGTQFKYIYIYLCFIGEGTHHDFAFKWLGKWRSSCCKCMLLSGCTQWREKVEYFSDLFHNSLTTPIKKVLYNQILIQYPSIGDIWIKVSFHPVYTGTSY